VHSPDKQTLGGMTISANLGKSTARIHMHAAGRVTRFDEFSPFVPFFTSGNFSENSKRSPKFSATFLQKKLIRLSFIFGYIWKSFFEESIRSPWPTPQQLEKTGYVRKLEVSVT
jgi:hypothetical protein